MKTEHLTNLINGRIELLRVQLNSCPQGGDFTSLRRFLFGLQSSIRKLLISLDDIENGPQRDNNATHNG